MNVEGGFGRALGRSTGLASAPSIPGAAALRSDHAYFVAKRLLDLVLGVFLLILALPVLILAAVAIAVTTRSNPLLRQRRVGLRGTTFMMLKLRTMREEASADAPPFSKVPHDPRVTAVGALLRRTSIDELPQLLNVLAGQMSLVGPRPILPAEAATLPPSRRRRFAVRPGLTGLWQVSGRSSLPLERWMALDRLYARRRSLLLDVAILVRTLGAVVTMRGAW
jgi:lipopolysaccharide/colanic/teichoic acid biosynthesis glycosyltransferase